jgi:hypothetical protein
MGNAERLLVALKIRLGRYDLMQAPNGQSRAGAAVDIVRLNGAGRRFRSSWTTRSASYARKSLPGMDSAQLIAEAQGHVDAAA